MKQAEDRRPVPSRAAPSGPAGETPSPTFPAWVWGVFVALFALTVPWYWPSGTALVIGGLPVWVVASLLASLAVAAFTAYAIFRYWPDGDREDAE